jgi:hypothetical protein
MNGHGEEARSRRSAGPWDENLPQHPQGLDEDADGREEDDDEPLGKDLETLRTKIAQLEQERAEYEAHFDELDARMTNLSSPSSLACSEDLAPLPPPSAAAAAAAAVAAAAERMDARRSARDAGEPVDVRFVHALRSCISENRALRQAVASLERRVAHLEQSQHAAASGAERRRRQPADSRRHPREDELAGLEDMFHNKTARTEEFLRAAADQLDPRRADGERAARPVSRSDARPAADFAFAAEPLAAFPSSNRRTKAPPHSSPARGVPPAPFIVGSSLGKSMNVNAFREASVSTRQNQFSRLRTEIAELDDAYQHLLARRADRTSAGIAQLASVVDKIETKRRELDGLREYA